MARRVRFLSLATASVLFIALPVGAAGPAPQLNPATIARALSDQPDDPFLNFMSGLAYEATATASTEARELARVGYLMALRQDSGFWRAAYQLGIMALEDRDAAAAQQFFLTAAANAPGELRILRALARAAYCAGDLNLAAAALAKANAQQAPASDDDFLTAALIAASRNDRPGVEMALPHLTPQLREAITNRLAAPRDAALMPSSAGPQTAAALPAAKQMAVVDVVIIRRNESSGTSNGINLLDSLSLQFGGSLINRNWNKLTDQIDPSLSTSTVSSDGSVQLTIPAVTYSLNLANARGSSSRIEARPTLLIYDEVAAKVFNGGTLTFATDGQLSSSSETREVGLSLLVKPKFINDNTVNLAVTVMLESFMPSAQVGSFRQAVQTEKSSTEIAADLRFGQTMLVSGGSSRTVTRGRSKTPVAGSIPLIGKLFSAKSETQQDNELLVLLSLRRVPGQGGQRETDSEQRTMAALRQRLFPDLDDGVRLAPETRQMFYRLQNPARTGTEAYLAPLASKSDLKKLTASD